MKITEKINKYILITVLFLGVNSYSCNCQKIKSIKREFKKSEIVISGTVISKRTVNYKDIVSTFKLTKYEKLLFEDYFSVAPFRNEVTILISKIYKGIIKKEEIIITTGVGNGDCGYPFKVGSQYIIYANKENIPDFLKNIEINYFTSICTRTKIFTANEELKIMKIKKCIEKKSNRVRTAHG